MERDPYLQAMGITQWQRRERAATAELPVDEVIDEASKVVEQKGSAQAEVIDINTDIQPNDIAAISNMDWDKLQSQVSTCTGCELHSSRTNTVFGVGDKQADWLIVGEAPGADEDRQGEPFVGRAGKLLTSMIEAVGYKREQVYIANILKCRPPSNRDPKTEEVVSCQPYLRRQIELLQPKIILAVGRIAAQSLLGLDKPMKTLRGQQYEYADTGLPVVVTYHPAYLLRSPIEKRKVWQDLKMAKRISARTL